jgi:hypothetical protein
VNVTLSVTYPSTVPFSMEYFRFTSRSKLGMASLERIMSSTYCISFAPHSMSTVSRRNIPVELQILNSFFLSPLLLLKSLDSEKVSVDIYGICSGKGGNGAGALKDIVKIREFYREDRRMTHDMFGGFRRKMKD